MLFSILIPVYNVEKYLPECIESVLNQGENDLEIILCDDGSTDNSGKICDEYKEKYPDIIKVIHKENEGLLLTRRVAIKASKGDWLVHLDSDDYMMPNALSSIRKIIEKHKDIDMVMFKIIYGQKDLNDFSVESKLPFTNEQIFENESKQLLYNQLLLGGYLTSYCQKIVKRGIVDIDVDYHKWPNVSMAEDYLQTLPIFNNSKKSIFIDTSLIYYRYNDKSITTNINLNSIISSIYSLISVNSESINYIEKWNIYNIDKVYSKQIRSIANKIFFLIIKFSYDELINFLNDLSNNEYLNFAFKNCDKKSLGKLTCIMYYLLLNKQFRLLFFLFHKRFL